MDGKRPSPLRLAATFPRSRFLLCSLPPSQPPSLFFPINLPLFLPRLGCQPVRNAAQNRVFLSRVPREVSPAPEHRRQPSPPARGDPLSRCPWTGLLASAGPADGAADRGRGTALLSSQMPSGRGLEMRGCQLCPRRTSRMPLDGATPTGLRDDGLRLTYCVPEPPTTPLCYWSPQPRESQSRGSLGCLPALPAYHLTNL